MWSNNAFKKQNSTVVKLFQERVTREPEKACFYFEDKTWTVADVSKNEMCVGQRREIVAISFVIPKNDKR
jgi:hypothetical protein